MIHISISRIFLLIALLIATYAGCEEQEKQPFQPAPDTKRSILPLGDSRVEGARPNFESYRYELWKNLVENDWEFDFVGTRRDGADYPEFLGQSFDVDHEGTGGATTEDIIATISKVINVENAPDIVLLGIGGNDLIEGSKNVDHTLANINQIIDILQSQNDSVAIFLEQIAPGRSDFMTPAVQSAFDEFNRLIPDIATQQSSNTSQVVVVDMASGWNDDYMADEVHYNVQGAREVSDRYYTAMKDIL